MPYGVALPRTGSAKSCTFTRSGAPAGIHSTPLFAKFPTNSFFFASHEMTGSPDPWNAATCVLMYRNWASRSGCWRPSTVLALPCRLYPAFFNSRPTVSALTSCRPWSVPRPGETSTSWSTARLTPDPPWSPDPPVSPTPAPSPRRPLPRQGDQLLPSVPDHPVLVPQQQPPSPLIQERPDLTQPGRHPVLLRHRDRHTTTLPTCPGQTQAIQRRALTSPVPQLTRVQRHRDTPIRHDGTHGRPPDRNEELPTPAPLRARPRPLATPARRGRPVSGQLRLHRWTPARRHQPAADAAALRRIRLRLGLRDLPGQPS